MSTSQQSSGGSGIGLVIVFIVVIGLVAVMFLTVPLSKDAVDRARSESEATQAQAQAQQAAERERTERERLSQETAQRGAELRAESTARTQDTVMTIMAAGVIVFGVMLLGGGAIYALDWADSKRVQRTLLIIEAQRQATPFLQLPAPNVTVHTFDRAETIGISGGKESHAQIQSDR